MAGVEDLILAVLSRHAKPQQPDALCAAGDGYLRDGDMVTSIAFFDRALRLDSGCARAWVGRARVLMRQGRAEALACIERALDAEPGAPAALVMKGDILRKRAAREEALACYEEALAVSPELIDAWLSRATVLYELKRMTDAARAVERFLSLARDDHSELLTARMMLAELERAGAKPKPQTVPPPRSAPPVQQPPTRSAAPPGQAAPPAQAAPPVETERKSEKKSDRSARTSDRKIAAAEKKSIRAEKKSMKTEAAAEVRAARKSLGSMPAIKVSVTPKAKPGEITADDLAAFDEVRGLCLQDRQVEALRKLEPIVKRCPESREAWVLRTQILFALKQFDAALTSVERAIRLEPNEVDAVKVLVKILSALKKDTRALEAADRVLALAPKDPEAHRARADCLVVLMKPGDAIFSYDKVIHYLPEDASAWLGRGRALRQLRRFAEARTALTTALSLSDGVLPDVAAQVREIIAKLPP